MALEAALDRLQSQRLSFPDDERYTGGTSIWKLGPQGDSKLADGSSRTK